MTPKVVVIGDVMLDVAVSVRAPRSHGSDTPSRIVAVPGGAAANQAVWLARGGADVAVVGVVGDDPIGVAAIAALEAADVDVAWVRRAVRPTGVVVAIVDADGQRSMLTDRGANLALDRAALAGVAATLRAGDHVHVSGYVLLDEPTREAGLAARDLAIERGATWSIDACSEGPLRALGPSRFLEWASGASFLCANLDEGRALSGLDEPEAVAARLASKAAEVVVTAGAQGSVVATATSLVRRGSDAPPDSVADTTGAGDAYFATYLARRLTGASIDEAMRDAGGAASLAVASPGARGWGGGYSRE